MATFLSVLCVLIVGSFVVLVIRRLARLSRDLRAERLRGDVLFRMLKKVAAEREDVDESQWDALEIVARDVDIVRASLGDLRSSHDNHVNEVNDAVAVIGADVGGRTHALHGMIRALDESVTNCTDVAAARIQALSDEVRRIGSECLPCVRGETTEDDFGGNFYVAAAESPKKKPAKKSAKKRTAKKAKR